jgi:hypothetical protein
VGVDGTGLALAAPLCAGGLFTLDHEQSRGAAGVHQHGRLLWSVRVSNDRDALTDLLGRVDGGDEVGWAVDFIGCETALLRTVLTHRRSSGHLPSRAHGQDDVRGVRRGSQDRPFRSTHPYRPA